MKVENRHSITLIYMGNKVKSPSVLFGNMQKVSDNHHLQSMAFWMYVTWAVRNSDLSLFFMENSEKSLEMQSKPWSKNDFISLEYFWAMK